MQPKMKHYYNCPQCNYKLETLNECDDLVLPFPDHVDVYYCYQCQEAWLIYLTTVGNIRYYQIDQYAEIDN